MHYPIPYSHTLWKYAFIAHHLTEARLAFRAVKCEIKPYPSSLYWRFSCCCSFHCLLHPCSFKVLYFSQLRVKRCATVSVLVHMHLNALLVHLDVWLMRYWCSLRLHFYFEFVRCVYFPFYAVLRCVEAEHVILQFSHFSHERHYPYRWDFIQIILHIWFMFKKCFIL